MNIKDEIKKIVFREW